MKIRRASFDKAHRCPECWSIPEKAHKHGRAKAFRLYRCECGTIWMRGFRIIAKYKNKRILRRIERGTY